MAIDTAAKRKSCVGLALLFLRLGVIPDNSDLAAAERLHTQALYSGIAAAGVSAVTAANSQTIQVPNLSGLPPRTARTRVVPTTGRSILVPTTRRTRKTGDA